jgi:hypothetical protein
MLTTFVRLTLAMSSQLFGTPRLLLPYDVAVPYGHYCHNHHHYFAEGVNGTSIVLEI